MNDVTGRLIGIWIKRAHRGRMEPVDGATLVEGRGLEGNANQGGRRQVTLLEQEAWEKMMSLLRVDADPAIRRANLLVSGIGLAHSRGQVLKVGSCRLLVRGETRPCRRMEEALSGLRALMRENWRGGIYTEVLQGGKIALDEPVCWE